MEAQGEKRGLWEGWGEGPGDKELVPRGPDSPPALVGSSRCTCAQNGALGPVWDVRENGTLASAAAVLGKLVFALFIRAQQEGENVRILVSQRPPGGLSRHPAHTGRRRPSPKC